MALDLLWEWGHEKLDRHDFELLIQLCQREYKYALGLAKMGLDSQPAEKMEKEIFRRYNLLFRGVDNSKNVFLLSCLLQENIGLQLSNYYRLGLLLRQRKIWSLVKLFAKLFIGKALNLSPRKMRTKREQKEQ